ncbi:MAG: Rieske 2Fe-2S domain-containing protein [Aigarchaeota archaeon]|nr:Rieske 2Fe-2S domain-containing protein [Aigarchaeota archaeon]MDW8093304.1 Rieske 2Fe-2S domain-containing protein [Nitrososphaerota archaeon]
MENRRKALKFILAAGTLVAIAPLATGRDFFYRKETQELPRQKIANLKELSEPGSYVNFVYPKTGDQKIDSDPFRQFILIKTKDNKLRAFSRVCVHLWCLPSYFPQRGELICPCHGSVYREEDGVGIEGPVLYQTYPTNALPMVELEVEESTGDVYAVGIDGILGYGRNWRDRTPDSMVKRV